MRLSRILLQLSARAVSAATAPSGGEASWEGGLQEGGLEQSVMDGLADVGAGVEAKEEISEETRLMYIVISVALVLMAGLMSGLTLGLLTLDAVDLGVLQRAGSDKEKRYAKLIEPVVRHQHWLLVTLLLNNALAMEALPIFLDRLLDPVTAVIFSVSFVLIFGEVFPQAICSRYGLAVGAYSAWFVHLLMWLTSPVSWPISKMLDCVLGHGETALFRRGQLKALVDIHGEKEELGGDLTVKETKVIRGALDLTAKTGMEVMTPIDKCFMLALDATLDRVTLSAILATGHSRVPVHAPEDKTDIVGLILVKELILLNPDAGTKVVDVKVRSIPRLSAVMPLYDLLALFETGRSHMAVLTGPVPLAALERLQEGGREGETNHEEDKDGSEGSERGGQEEESSALFESASCDSIYVHNLSAPAVGIITLEDIVEELLQAEIVDETDRYIDNEQTKIVNARQLTQELPPKLQTLLSRQGSLPSHGLLGRIKREVLGGSSTPVYDAITHSRPGRMHRMGSLDSYMIAGADRGDHHHRRESRGQTSVGTSAVGGTSPREQVDATPRGTNPAEPQAAKGPTVKPNFTPPTAQRRSVEGADMPHASSVPVMALPTTPGARRKPYKGKAPVLVPSLSSRRLAVLGSGTERAAFAAAPRPTSSERASPQLAMAGAGGSGGEGGEDGQLTTPLLNADHQVS